MRADELVEAYYQYVSRNVWVSLMLICNKLQHYTQPTFETTFVLQACSFPIRHFYDINGATCQFVCIPVSYFMTKCDYFNNQNVMQRLLALFSTFILLSGRLLLILSDQHHFCFCMSKLINYIFEQRAK